MTSLGRIDAVLELMDAVYIIEFKMAGDMIAKAALKQIKAKQYDAPYRGQGKPIVLLGIAFDGDARTIGSWKHEVT